MVIVYCFCLFSSAARLLLQFNTAKLVNIFHSTKYFDKNFQNIFNYFFSLPREKVFPAQRANFLRFLMVQKNDARTQGRRYISIVLM